MADESIGDVAPFPTSPRFKNLTGRVFSRLTVVHYAGDSKWVAKCACGNVVTVGRSNLVSGHTQSCGCYAKEILLKRLTKHGARVTGKRTPEVRAYDRARCRCTNPNDQHYKSYGGRGIEFRFTSFPEFLEHIGNRPTNKHSLDRIDVNGHYEKGNVRWATSHEQAHNRTDTCMVEADGETLSIFAWSDRYGVSFRLIYQRMYAGWCGPCAVKLPLNQRCKHRSQDLAKQALDTAERATDEGNL